MRAAPLLCGFALALTWAPHLRAQTTKTPVATPIADAPPAGSVGAEELFREGRAAAEAGDFATARDRFSASEKLEPAPGTLLNIADCEVHLGRILSAREHFELAASGFPKNDSRRAFAMRRVADIEGRLAQLTVHLAQGLPEDARVTRDGAAFDRRTADKAIQADPRAATFVVSAPGFMDRTFTVQLAEGQSAEVTLGLGEPASIAGVPSSSNEGTAQPGAPRSTWQKAGFVAGGVGIGGLVVGAVTGALALHEASVVKSNCQIPGYACNPEGVSAGSSGQSLAVASTIAFVAGAALTATGVLLVVTGRKHGGESPTLAFVPYASPSGGGAFTTWTF